MKKYIKQISKKTKKLKSSLSKQLVKLEKVASKRPYLSLGVLLLILFVLIWLSNFLQKPIPENEIEKSSKQVEVFSVGEAPRINVSAKVEKENVITIVSQTAGIVRNINVEVGQYVYSGQQLSSLSTDYYGSNAPAIQRQLAQVQYDNLLATYELQTETIAKQKDLANIQQDNAEELREITSKSIGETEELLDLNESILADVNLALSVATDSAEIASLKGQKSQLLSGINQIKSALRQAKYQGDDDNPPAQLADVSRDITIKQLELQEKSLEMSKLVSELQLKLARVQEASMYPGTPCSGVVERILVQPGDFVTPGTPLFIINADQGSTQLIANVSKDVANRVSITEPSYIYIDGQAIEVYPDYVSQIATDGTLFSLTYSLTDDQAKNFANSSHTKVSVPLGSADTNSVIPFLPLDAIYQSELETTVYILVDGKVESLKVELGQVSGRFVEVKSGLSQNTQVILDRSVIEGQTVEAL